MSYAEEIGRISYEVSGRRLFRDGKPMIPWEKAPHSGQQVYMAMAEAVAAKVLNDLMQYPALRETLLVQGMGFFSGEKIVLDFAKDKGIELSESPAVLENAHSPGSDEKP